MKNSVSVILVIALLNISTLVKAGENDAMVDMMLNMFKQSGAIGPLSNCLDIPEPVITKAYKKLVGFCILKDGLEGNCMESLAPEYFGVSNDKFLACTSDDTEVAEQEEEVDYSTLSEEERTALLAKQQAEGMALLESMTALVKKNSKGTEGEISLPIYSPSTIITNYTSGMENSKGEMTLPMASFTTKDSVEKVTEFYKKSLPDFEIKYNMNTYYVMKKIPEDLTKLSFDTENLPLYFIPHIAFYSSSASGQKETTIVISYKPN